MRFSFTYEHGLIIVPVRLTGKQKIYTAHLALDTGATRTMINNHIAVYLGYDPATSKERIQITTASGVEFSSMIQVQMLEALGAKRESFPLLCHTLPPSAAIDGLLGLDFFRNTILTIDFQQKVLTLSN